MKQLKPFLLLVTFFSLFILNCNSQDAIKQYAPAWKKVEDLVKKKLPQSALTEVKKIYALAKKDKQDAQVIKALVYITGLQRENRENNDIFSISEMEKEIAESKEPVADILKSMLAEMYWNYFQQNRWVLYNRTTTSQSRKEDIATWTAADFHKKTGELYLQSIRQDRLLQKISLQLFDAVILKGNMRHLRPTLYDLLAQRALSYFENDERDISRPAYAFEIDEAAAFKPAQEFINKKFSTKDSLSLEYNALLIYQKLLAFHLRDANPDALVDADIHRIQFVKNKSVHPEKEQLYFNAINHIARQYENRPVASQAWYLMAAFYEQQASGYSPFGDTAHRYDRIKAKEICQRILLQKDSSEGKINCYNLLTQINSRQLQFSIEKVNVPELPFRALIEYRNFTQLHLRLIKPGAQLKKLLQDQYGDKYWSGILAAATVRTWEQPLPATNDMQTHNVEIKIDALPQGEYILLAGTDKNFSDKKTLIGARLFYISNISFVNKEDDFFVLNRDNGQPISNASVQVWEQKYDYRQSKYITEKTKLYKTNTNGFFKKEKQTEEAGKRYSNFSYQLDIAYKNDRLFMNDLINDYYYRNNEEPSPKNISTVFIFTDRSIYRPGQTLFFKGIVLNRVKEEKKARANNEYETTIYLRDANARDVDSIKVKTNEYGSFSGKFQLPSTGLNGSFSLYTKNDNGYAGLQVEEYKRPKFYVDYEPLKKTYKVKDSIKITGYAKAYAGNNIDGAPVKYRVVRQPRFIYPWLFWRGWFPPAAPMEIAHGEATTDKDGKFSIDFIAIPDLSIDKKLDPIFDYTVYADITDINGETRSGEQRISVSYKSLIIKTNIPATITADSLKTLSIRTENMNGEFVPAYVKVIITRLKDEQRLIRNRYWERPDQFVMTKEEYLKNFPHDEYDNETDLKSREKGEIVYEKSDSLRAGGDWPLAAAGIAPGAYAVQISSKDKYGEEVSDIKFIELYDEKDNQLNSPKYLWTEGAKPIEPGEKTTVKLGTSADNLFLLQQTDKSTEAREPGSANTNYTYTKLNHEKRSFEFSATEADRGGYGVSWLFVKHNRVYQFNQTITVPWTNKELVIEYATYRDKTLPGSEEKWKLKMTGNKNEKVAAEMLASMYDASLDQFYPHQWNKPSVWPSYYSGRGWNGNQNFAKIESNVKPGVYPDSKFFPKQYDQLISPLYGEVITVGYGRDMDRALTGRAVGLEMAEMKMSPPSIAKDDEVRNEPLPNQQESDSGGVVKAKGKPSFDNSVVQVRKNFKETAFFFPDLKTDEKGGIEFSFTMPEALTKWKFQALAHTKDGALGYSEKEIITQKQLMVQPNAPRFLREGDKIEFSSKIVNLSEKELTGQAELQLIDASTNQPVDGWFNNIMPKQFFTIAAGQSESVKFPMAVPYQFNKVLLWRIIAKADFFSDGEENALPVLSNRMLVTETMSLHMKGAGTKHFSFDKLLKSGNSETLQHYALTVEYTSNPAWYAIQALPYLAEYPYDCAEQTWNRYYANSIASLIANSSPRIRKIFDQWKIADSAAFMSNLQKNQELKAILLEETPWVLQAKTEAEQKKNLALLFDMVRMSKELNNSYEKLKQMQSSNGGFVWFMGGPDDRYMTQYIITGIGHLKKLKGQGDASLEEIVATAIPYLDNKIKKDYDDLLKYKTDLKKYSPDYSIVQYLYMRSFFPEYKISAANTKAYDYFKSRAQLTWTQQNKFMQGMIALALHRSGEKVTPASILKSLKETSIKHEELGMYWKDARRGWFWHEAPVERQALLIEAFQEIEKDIRIVDDMRTWLLKNKQTNNWESTKATAEACYALLIQGTDWLNNEPVVQIKLGKTIISSAGNKKEAGTGYFKKILEGKTVTPELGNISITVSQDPGKDLKGVSSWGGIYWQYFENLDKITNASTPLQLEKKLFVEKNTDRGPVLTPVNDGDILKIGYKIKVRIELRVDRQMEYVHMKDMRASAMEPVNVLSSYKWQGSLGYYETTRDASTHFFFGNLQKGTYVFEYPLFITHTGDFSNGITSIQSMYAPEFSSHSEGIRIRVE